MINELKCEEWRCEWCDSQRTRVIDECKYWVTRACLDCGKVSFKEEEPNPYRKSKKGGKP
jgi:hypothetical protein